MLLRNLGSMEESATIPVEMSTFLLETALGLALMEAGWEKNPFVGVSFTIYVKEILEVGCSNDFTRGGPGNHLVQQYHRVIHEKVVNLFYSLICRSSD